MDLIADGLLIATTLTAALYCIVLSRRLRRLTDASSGIGARIQALNVALEDAKSGLAETRRGVAEARGTVRSTREALAAEVMAARETCAALTKLCHKARDTLAQLDEAERGVELRLAGAGMTEPPRPDPLPPEPEPEQQPATAPDAGLASEAEPAAPASGEGAPSAPEAPVEAFDDTIPDWPDGVVNLETASEVPTASDHAGEAALRVRRVDL